MGWSGARVEVGVEAFVDISLDALDSGAFAFTNASTTLMSRTERKLPIVIQSKSGNFQ